MAGSLAATIALRPAQEDDRALLLRIYASTRQEELASLDWDQSQKDWFVAMQFDFQARSLAGAFPEADTAVVLRSRQPIGRLVLDRAASQIRLVDISLLPEHRQAGIGSLLIRAVQDEAATAGKEVVLHVAKLNRARALYERLGFAACGQDDVYLEMRWSAEREQQ